MKKRLLKFIKAPFYFALLAAYPVLALLAYNIIQVSPASGVRPLFLSILVAGLLFLLLRLVYRSWHRASFAVAMLAVLFYTYGHVYDLLLKKWDPPALSFWMLGLWLALAVLFLVLTGIRRIKFIKATPILNVVSLGLVIFSTVQAIRLSVPPGGKDPSAEFAPVQQLAVPEGETPPDIYYIIVDSYGRSDLLLRNFKLDNSGFIQNLQGMGFYVADCSQSNYPRTDVSLASSLNLEYLQNLDGTFKAGNLNRARLWSSLVHNTVSADLRSAGYKTVAFATGFPWSEITNSDVYLAPSPVWSQMTGFETLLMRTTPLRHLEDLGWIDLDRIDGLQFRQRTDFVFNSMTELAHMSGPKFVFIHMIPPHPPFVYAADGSWTDPGSFLDQNRRFPSTLYNAGIRNQVQYVDGQLETAIATLLSGSQTPPVIIVQGDHAPWLQTGPDKFAILNAYYLPGHNDLLYPTISPVNTFRLVLDTYLGADYPLLEDKSYNSPVPDIYNFSEETNPCTKP